MSSELLGDSIEHAGVLALFLLRVLGHEFFDDSIRTAILAVSVIIILSGEKTDLEYDAHIYFVGWKTWSASYFRSVSSPPRYILVLHNGYRHPSVDLYASYLSSLDAGAITLIASTSVKRVCQSHLPPSMWQMMYHVLDQRMFERSTFSSTIPCWQLILSHFVPLNDGEI